MFELYEIHVSDVLCEQWLSHEQLNRFGLVFDKKAPQHSQAIILCIKKVGPAMPKKMVVVVALMACNGAEEAMREEWEHKAVAGLLH